MKLLSLTLAVGAVATLPLNAAILVNSSAFSYSQNFDSLASSPYMPGPTKVHIPDSSNLKPKR